MQWEKKIGYTNFHKTEKKLQIRNQRQKLIEKNTKHAYIWSNIYLFNQDKITATRPNQSAFMPQGRALRPKYQAVGMRRS